MVDSLAYGSATKVVADDILTQKTKNKINSTINFFFTIFYNNLYENCKNHENLSTCH